MKVRDQLKATVQDTWAHGLLQKFRHYKAYKRWKNGETTATPPELFKQCLVKDYAAGFGLPCLVETGTFYGDMVRACRTHFGEIYSIELNDDLFHRAQKAFGKHTHIHLYHGDSGKVLSGILGFLDQPCLFWLDAHAMGGIPGAGEKTTPILEELDQILESVRVRYVLLIDDARLFGCGGYPRLREIERRILDRHPDWQFFVENDVIRAHPA